MSLEKIIILLKKKSIFTDNELMRLSANKNSSDFLKMLLALYKEKTVLYLQSCDGIVQRTLMKESEVTIHEASNSSLQKIINFAYANLFMRNPISTIPCLLHLLANEPELLVAIGLKISYDGKSFYDEMHNVFINYFSLNCIFHDINDDDLLELCTQAESDKPSIFPVSLFRVFQLETALYNKIAAKLQEDKSDNNQYKIWATFSCSEEKSLYQCAYSTIQYICSVLCSSGQNIDSNRAYFQHLSAPEKQLQFSAAIGTGYKSALQSEEKIKSMHQYNKKICEISVSQKCLPAMSLLGFDVRVSFDSLDYKLKLASAKVSYLAALKIKADEELQNDRDKANKQISDYIANIPFPPLGISFQSGNMPFNHK